MSIIYHKMNSRKWIENIKAYIIDGKINVANLWCCEKNVCANMLCDNDILAVSYEENDHVEMLCKVVAYGKTGVQYPECNESYAGITIEDMYEKNFQHTIETLKNNYINGLNENDTLKDFLYEINNSIGMKGGFTSNSKMAYIIVKPFLFSCEYEIGERNMMKFIQRIKDFNEKNKDYIDYNMVHVDERGTIVLRKRAKF